MVCDNDYGLTQEQIIELGKAAEGKAKKYAISGRLKGMQILPRGVFGAALFLATVCYPLSKDSKHKDNFYRAIMSMYFRDLIKRNPKIKNEIPMIVQKNFLLSPRKDKNKVNQTIRAGSGRFLKRLQAIHVLLTYEHSVERDPNVTYDQVLSKVSSVYESKHSKASIEQSTSANGDLGTAEKSRMDNLRRVHKDARPVYHLLYGFMEAREHRRVYGLEELIYNPSWLESAVHIAEQWLDSYLLEYEYKKLGGMTVYDVTLFEPNEVIHVELMPL